jgi:hypothetical protein
MRFEIIQNFITQQSKYTESKHFKESDAAFDAIIDVLKSADTEEFAMLYKGVETAFLASRAADMSYYKDAFAVKVSDTTAQEPAKVTTNSARFSRLAAIMYVMGLELNARAFAKYRKDDETPSAESHGGCGKYYDALMIARNAGESVEEQSKIILGIK